MKTQRAELLPTRQSLLIRLKDLTDQESWQQFFDTYSDLLYSVAIKAGLNDAEAKDVVQDTVISVARKMAGFDYDPAKGSFKGWLLRLAQWRIQDQFRSRKRQGVPLAPATDQTERTPLVEQLEDPAPPLLAQILTAEWDRAVLRVALEQVRQRVNPKDFQIYDLYVLQQWPVEDVMETLDVGRAKIYLAKHRVGALVRKEIRRAEAQLNKGPGSSK
jgi:RNA polymerase sigma-70 factor (ECF subfamily)